MDFENHLTAFYENAEIPRQLRESVFYSLTAGGKRVRPRLFLMLLEGFGLSVTDAHLEVASALEMIHTGSLIHDDLPAMDDDELRRGKATNHVAFDEATAILAGDALFLDPWYLLSAADLPADKVVKLVRELSFASGSLGMVAGQVLDMAGEGKQLTQPEIEDIHRLKTGRLLTFPFVAAGILADKDVEKLRQIGAELGLAFQIRDDILDVTSDAETLGKTPGKDLTEEKSTYVRLLGLDGAKMALSDHLTAVRRELTAFDGLDASEILALVKSLEVE